ncbi:MAG: hypothetical protein FJ405_13170, partial [Verrucomicrobia bacterium]|nr:hypothetical protein [Verrucomicrobiota bacterium]
MSFRSPQSAGMARVCNPAIVSTLVYSRTLPMICSSLLVNMLSLMNRKFTLILEVALLIFALPLAGGSKLLAAAAPPTGTRTSRFVTQNPEEFAKLIAPGVDAKVILNDVGRFTAGPVWSTRDQCLYFSEIPTNTLMKWSPQTGLSAFRRPSDFACGNVFDLEGRLLTSQNSRGRIVMMLPDGSVTPYITEHQTNRFNSPF